MWAGFPCPLFSCNMCKKLDWYQFLCKQRDLFGFELGSFVFDVTFGFWCSTGRSMQKFDIYRYKLKHYG